MVFVVQQICNATRTFYAKTIKDLNSLIACKSAFKIDG